MESVGTKNYRQRSETLGFEAPAPHIVVACPSCRTSFAVETAAVAALETPRFHCSRCDDIFIMKDAPADMLSPTGMLPLAGVQVQSVTHAAHSKQVAQTHSSEPYSSRDNRSKRPLPESLIQPSDFSLGSTVGATKTFVESNPATLPESPSANRSELSLLSRGWDEAQDEIVAEAFGYEQPQKSAVTQQPVDPTPQSRFVLSEPLYSQTPIQPASAKQLETTTAVAPNLSPRQFVLSDTYAAEPSQADAAARSSTTSSPTIEPPTPAQPRKAITAQKPAALKNTRPLHETETYRPTPPPRRGDRNSVVGAPQGRLSPRTQGLLSMAVPILATLAILLGISYCARLSPRSIDALANLAMPSFAQGASQALPPSALGVKNLKLSFKKTRNKEIIAVVSGAILNESGRTFEGVELEAIGFNERGEIISSSRAPLRSALGNENIAELSRDTVGRFQKSLAAKNSSIAAREAVPFTVALLDGRQLSGEQEKIELDASKVRYFSARIFSVTKNK